jgi:hypothetical protein
MNAIDQLDQAAYEMYNALQVICKDPVISNWLYAQDRYALKQAQDAVQVYVNRNDKEWMEKRYGAECSLDQVTVLQVYEL